MITEIPIPQERRRAVSHRLADVCFRERLVGLGNAEPGRWGEHSLRSPRRARGARASMAVRADVAPVIHVSAEAAAEATRGAADLVGGSHRAGASRHEADVSAAPVDGLPVGHEGSHGRRGRSVGGVQTGLISRLGRISKTPPGSGQGSIPALRLKVWGCRGSIAASGPETIRYGGNTACVQVRPSDGRMLILDAGTGVRALGVALRHLHLDRIDILLSHLHFDHIQGLGFFAPVFDPSCEIHLWGPRSSDRPLREELQRIFSPPAFPVRLYDLPARFVVHDVPDRAWELGSARIAAEPVDHPGTAVGYRIEDKGRVLAYLPDHEPAREPERWTGKANLLSGYALAYRADVLIQDAQYTEVEYGGRVGWGHSSVAHAVEFARRTQARKLVMFHHDPSRSDHQLEAIFARSRVLWGNRAGGVALARDGMAIDIPERGPLEESEAA